MHIREAFLPSALLALLLPGCDFGLELVDRTPGVNGVLEFQYVSSQCALGCGLERPVLEGARIEVEAIGSAVDARTKARSTPDAIGASTSTTRCDAGRCRVTLSLEAASSGEATIAVEDAQGRVLDTSVVHVEKARSLETSLTVDERDVPREKDGAFVVHAGSRPKLKTVVLTADGRPMVFTQHGLDHHYADPDLIARDEEALFGSTDVEDMVAKKAGDTTVTVLAHGAEQVVVLRVLP